LSIWRSAALNIKINTYAIVKCCPSFAIFQDEKEKNAALKEQTSQSSTEATVTAPDTPSSPSQQMHAQFSPPFPSPPPMGQFPFGMPFPPGFPPFPQQGTPTASNFAAQVPRFPLPYSAPFSPPFPPAMMRAGNFPFANIMPSMQIPPLQQGVPAQTSLPPNEDSSRTGASYTPRDSTPDVENIGNQSEPESSARRDTSLSSQAQNETNSQSQENVNTSSQSQTSEVRQRRTTRPNPDTQSAEIPTHDRPARTTYTSSRRGDMALLIFGLFVISVIVLLMIRRLKMMNVISL